MIEPGIRRAVSAAAAGVNDHYPNEGAHVQVVSFGLVALLALAVALVIALAILASPLFAAVIFVVAFGAFLVWRGSRRANVSGPRRRGVPSTEEAAGDPVEDSGVRVTGRQAVRPPAGASGPSADPR
jgi:hypothetical protein